MITTAPARWQRGLYFVTPELADTATLLALVEQVLVGGAVMLQYRSKYADRSLRHAQATALREMACAHCVPLIINDDVELAHAAGADGVHLGRDDADIASARDVLGPEAIIGASCYASIERARDASKAGATYVAFGTVFASPTKPHAVRAPLSLLEESAAFGLPRVAIGGINLDNARSVVDAGANLIAVISAISEARDPLAVAALFAALFAAPIQKDGPVA